METLAQFKATRKSKPFTTVADLEKYVRARFEKRGFTTMGIDGAKAYLASFGRGIGLPKVLQLAATAEAYGYQELADGFYIEAYKLHYGTLPPAATTVTKPPAAIKSPVAAEPVPGWDFLPGTLRPGGVLTMQPTDALRPREFYVTSADYCGQPKRDGWRALIFATSERCGWQARLRGGQAGLEEFADAEITRALTAVAAVHGSFVLDAEQTFFSWRGSEHRTGSQAGTLNVQEGHGTEPVHATLCVFDCLYAYGQDMRPQAFRERIKACEYIVAELMAEAPGFFEFLAPVATEAGKRELTATVAGEKREGEIWRRLDAPYHNGRALAGRDKAHPFEPIVRTKYFEDFVVRVVALTPPPPDPKVPRLFGAVTVADRTTGKHMGNIGTGFTYENQQRLVTAFEEAQATGRPLHVRVTAPMLTETGILYQPVYRGMAATDEEA